ncbi:hypothetical protein AAHC03_013204 [Spirometra sp. Aus1]
MDFHAVEIAREDEIPLPSPVNFIVGALFVAAAAAAFVADVAVVIQVASRLPKHNHHRREWGILREDGAS